MSQNPPTPEIIIDILVCDKDYKFLRQIDDRLSNNRKLNVHITSVYNIDEIVCDLASSPFHFILIGPTEELSHDFNNILIDNKPLPNLIKVIGNESPGTLIKYLNIGIKNMVSIDSLLQNFQLVLDNIIQFGAFVDPSIITFIKPNLAKISQLTPFYSLLQPKAKAVFELLKNGHSYVEIADKLNISIDSVRYYIKIIYKKLNVKSKINAINKVTLLEDDIISF